jgi:hypothetical protein
MRTSQSTVAEAARRVARRAGRTLTFAALTVSLAGAGCERRSAGIAPSPRSARPARTLLLAFAAFKSDDLVECDDIELAGAALKKGADLKGAADQLWTSFSRPKDAALTMARLTRSCEDQFADRRPFGTCTDWAPWKPAPALRARTLHFSFPEVFRSDWAMRECLENGGQWSSLPRISQEFREAQLRFDTIEAQKSLGKLMR